MDTTNLLNRVNAEIAAGRIWRAKEILRGNIASGRIEPEVLEAYGRLLARLGETPEAGKYLFLSGAREESYSEAIAVFRKRIANRKASDLVGQLPAAIRRRLFHELPPTVQRQLIELGLDPPLFAGRRERLVTATTRGERLATVGCLVVLGVLFVALLLGLKSLFCWLRTWFG